MNAKQHLILVWIALTLALANRAAGQITPLPYYENFDNAASSRWTAFSLGTSDPDDFPWNITIHNPYSAPFSMMHTCTNGTAQANNWTVCKNAFSFTSGGKIDSIRSWITANNPPATNDTIGIYLLVGNANPALASTAILLHDFRAANFQTGSWIKTTNINIPPTPGSCYIAFRYKTANNCINIFLDNMQLSANVGTGILPVYKAGDDFIIAPNPAVKDLVIRSKHDFEQIHIYNIAGQRVHTQAFQPAIDISYLAPGAYILELIDRNKQTGIQKIVKQ
ncbi:T9SS type A sorting domain-containing protein [Taibaiella chishuiensis]|uniref:Putative secreted protein (Por secretion system target) n=1 Tax=Taibaiella chishuiensis TaxID=1434707 RepID=A0A2P8D736_9BACT|nr:T9SS type A sorting domain-containing protein [Taibaiella chishuiensis]PSK93033.1 putative secreted protein (Por secretion system target) [Taibaiella chishuiensis]